MAEKWPRTYHLHLAHSAQKSQEMGDFDRLITRVLLEEEKCIVMESPPRQAGTARNGNIKYRGCIVQVRDVSCMTSMHSRLQQNSIICRSRTYFGRS